MKTIAFSIACGAAAGAACASIEIITDSCAVSKDTNIWRPGLLDRLVRKPSDGGAD